MIARLRARLTVAVTDGAPIAPLGVLFLLNAVDELDRTAFSVLTPEIRADFGLNLAGVLGLVSLVEALGILLGVPLAYWADRRSRTRLAATGAFVWGTSSFLSGLAPGIGALAGARIGAGVGRSVTTPTHFSLLADYYPPEVRPKVYGAHRAANSLGQFAGPLAAGGLALWLGWRAPFMLFAFPTFVCAFLALRLTEPIRGAHERRAVGAEEEAALTEEEPPTLAEGWRLLWEVRTLRRIWYSLPFAAAIIVGFGSLFATFYESEFGLNSAQRGLAAAVTEPAQLLGLLAGVPVANRLLARDPALVMRFLSLVGVVVAAAFAVLAATPYLAMVIVMHMLISAAAVVLSPGAYAVLSLAMPPRARSLGFAVSALWILPGLALFPTIGALADARGVRPALFVLCPLLLVAGALLGSAGRFVNADINRARTVAAARSEALLARRRGEGPVLAVRGLEAGYGQTQVLHSVDLEVAEGQIVALLGTNGAGKSTLLRAVSGVITPSAGAVILDGVDLAGKAAHTVARMGVAQVPGGRGVFPSLTVGEHLRLAAAALPRGERKGALARAGDLFPVLLSRLDQTAGTLSGGEQQMLALTLATRTPPRLLLVDELSLALAPGVVEQLLGAVRRIAEAGTAVILVEQSVTTALRLADVALFMEKGEIRYRGPAAGLLERPDLLRAVFLAPPRSGPPLAPPAETAPPVFEAEGLTKRFGAVAAVAGVSLTVSPGTVLGIVGPNGAGKTTLFDLLSGFTRPDAGHVHLAGRDITALTADARARLGLGRSFSDARLFPSLTVAETLALACERHVAVRDPVAGALGLRAVRRSERCVGERVSGIIETMGLALFARTPVANLSTGTRRLVDLGCALAHEPSVLLLDEPSSGIAQKETEALGPVLRGVADDTGAALVVIEHDLPLITSLADELVVLHLGAVLAQGLPAEVLTRTEVATAYLGGALDGEFDTHG